MQGGRGEDFHQKKVENLSSVNFILILISNTKPPIINNHYNKNLRKYACELRNETISKAEKYIWKAGLKKKQLGVSFKRQRPIHNFIVDFFCPEVGLIIEIDGTSHNVKGSYDRYRQDKLEFFGYTVIRFQEGKVIHRYPEVEDKTRRAIEVLKSREI